MTALSLLGYDAFEALHTRIWGFSAILLRASHALSGLRGTVSGEPFSGLSTDVQLDSGLGSGWATQGHAQTFSNATPLFSWLCALGRCHVGRHTFHPVLC